MELNINLKTVYDEISNEKDVVRLNFVSMNEDVAKVDLSLEDLRKLTAFLATVSEKHIALGFLAPVVSPEGNSPD